MHVGDVGAGHQLLQVLHAVDALGFQGFAVQYADRGGHALGGFLTTASIDGNGAELGVLLHGRGGADRLFGEAATGRRQQHASGQGLQGEPRCARRPTENSGHADAP
ncbi:hypothetical protein D3C81_1557320 [compost metagenome]